jgi:hypothetical protein
MIDKMLIFGEKLYLDIKNIWETERMHRIISNFLVAVFLLSLILYFLIHHHIIPAKGILKQFENPFFSIEISFTFLLLSEIISMIFVLPKSVAKSVTKQFELLSLIFLRHGFQEFSDVHSLDWHEMIEPMKNMFIYGFVSLFIYFIIGIVYKKQRHILICRTDQAQRNFVRFKRFISLLLLVAFVFIVINDFSQLLIHSIYVTSFHTFFTILIFSDILVLLITMRYALDYKTMYRYSAFILATIFIRIALTSEPYYDIIIGTMASLYLLFLVMTYNYFEGGKKYDTYNMITRKRVPKKYTKDIK